MTATDTHRAIDAVWRIESPKVIAGLTRIVRDVGLAEDLAQDALVAALEQWPESGVPDKPGAWLMATAKHRAIDRLRRNERLERKQEQLGRELELQQEMAVADLDASSGDVGDDLLRLMFISCHPILATEARVALTLRLLGGLTTDEIARAFLVPEPTIAQRIVRAKRTLTAARVPFEVPEGAELAARLSSVLQVIYLVFNEGYAATAGDDWMRAGLCEDALRLGRILAGLAPAEPEVHGLVALMEIQASRSVARVGPSGEAVLLLDQDRARWDSVLIHRGLAALGRAEALGGARGPYALQAAIAACHARARTPAETDWPRIVALYDALAQLVPSPVVELNRAVAHGMAFGPAAGLELVDALMAEPALKTYHFLPSVRGDLLAKLGRPEEAHAEFEHAASLTQNAREREFLLQRAAACAQGEGPDGVSLAGQTQAREVAMGADPNRGKTIRWTYADGPMKGKAFEHHFTNDGTVSWKEAADQRSSADAKTAKDPKGGSADDSSAAYQFARINDDVYVFSYLSRGSGYTLTTIIDERTGKIISFASNEKELVIQHGELDGAKRDAA